MDLRHTHCTKTQGIGPIYCFSIYICCMKKLLLSLVISFAFFSNILAQGHPCQLPKYFEFKGHIQNKTTIYELGKDSISMTGETWINDSAKLSCNIIHADQPEMTISTIVHTPDSSTVLLMDMGPDSKSALCLTGKEASVLAAKNPYSNLISAIAGIKATGKTKTIQGKTCQEYRSDSSDYTIIAWCCDAIKGLNIPGAVPQVQGLADPGLMLELSLIDKKTHLISHTITTLFDTKATRRISTDGFE